MLKDYAMPEHQIHRQAAQQRGADPDLPDVARGDAEALQGQDPRRRAYLRTAQRRASGALPPAQMGMIDLMSVGGAGQAPDAGVRGAVERVTGADLSGARVHTGSESNQAAQALSAHAYTSGADIHFAPQQYQPQTREGQHLLAHELAHVAQQSRAGSAATQARLSISEPGDAAEVEADAIADRALGDGAPLAAQERPASGRAIQRRAAGDLRDPRVFPTYEEFLMAFQELSTFTARDTPGAHQTGFAVLGDRAADDSSPDSHEHGVTRRNTREGEQYINHPRADWIAEHLPPELRLVVYQMPADCADVAVMLRHVWLHAHGRTERFGSWTIGVGAGSTEEQRARSLTRLIRDQVYSGSVAAIVSGAYNGGGGRARSFAELEPLLHPGDVLVWEHHDAAGRRSGGHTQTIQSIQRSDPRHIDSIQVLQGNQPVFQDQADDIRAEEARQGQRQVDAGTLRDLPGRRIERSDLSGSYLQDQGGVWSWPDEGPTTLIAAGPPSGVQRPAPRRQADGTRRSVSDWSGALSRASAEGLTATFESAMIEARTGLEGDRYADEVRAQAPELGTAAGRRLRALSLSATRRQELGRELAAIARSVGAHLNLGGEGLTNGQAVFTQAAANLIAAAGVEDSAPATAATAS